MPRDVKHGRARVNDDALVGANQFGASSADGFFLAELMRVARGKCELVGLGRDDACAAMRALQIPGGFQDRQIATDSRDGRANVFGQVLKRRKLHLL